MKTIESRHQRCIRHALFKSAVNIAHANFTRTPYFLHYLALELSERRADNFSRSSKASKRETWYFHVAEYR